MSLRVIGIGNLDRGDDAAGRLVARRLRELAPAGIDVLELEGDAASLLDAWRGAGAVIVVDAAARGREPGSVARLDAARDEIPPGVSTGSTHGLGLAEAIALARALGELPGSLTVIGIEGERFEPGAGVSAAVGAAVERLAVAIATGGIG